MNQENIHVIRYYRIVLILLIWYGLGIAAFSFSIQKTINGIIELVIVGIFTYILIDGRLFLRLKDRKIPGAFLLVMYLYIAATVYLVIRDLRLNDLYVLDQLHYPGLIAYIRATGLIIILAFLFWETVAITRLYVASKKKRGPS